MWSYVNVKIIQGKPNDGQKTHESTHSFKICKDFKQNKTRLR